MPVIRKYLTKKEGEGMLKELDIQKMFDKMDLGSEKKRERFNKLSKLEAEVDNNNKKIFIHTTATSKVEDSEDAELA